MNPSFDNSPATEIDRGSFAGRFSGKSSSSPVSAAVGNVNPDSAFYLPSSDHQGAGSSPGRGYIYWRSRDKRRQITDFTDAEIQRRLDFLYNHSGVCRRLVNGCAELCGFLTPQPNTADEEWNEERFDSFQFGAMSPAIFDAGGHFNFYGAQVVTNQDRFRAGRSLGVLTKTKTGRAQVAFYDPYQIDHKHNGSGNLPEYEGKRIVRGVELGAMSRHLAYYLKDAEDRTKKPLRVPAEDALYFGKFDNHGQVHPLSILAGAIVNMTDVAETRGFWKNQLKSAGRRGEVIEQDPVQNHIHGGGIGASPVTVNITQPDGSNKTVELEQVYGNGPEIQKLSPGQRLKLVTDDRPSANNLEFDRVIVEDCSFFANLPPEALFKIAGVTGPGIRYSMGQISRWILIQHMWQATWCHRYYTYDTACELKAGRLREPVDSDGEVIPWWRHSQVLWIGLPNITIDKGQVGKLSISQLDVGFSTWADEWGAAGAFWKKKITGRVCEVAFAKLKAWQESKKLEAQTDGEVTLSADEVFKFANLGGNGSTSNALDPDTAELADRVDDLESTEENPEKSESQS